MGPVGLEELAPDIGLAGDFVGVAGPVDVVEPDVAIGVHPAFLACQTTLWMLPLPVG